MLYNALYMAQTRTQIYLRPDQRQRIDQVAAAEGVPLAEIVRRALDRYLEEEVVDPVAALKESFGSAPDLEPPSRDDWDRSVRG